MPIGTGSVSFSQIQAEFGGSNPISLSEYYRGGTYVALGTANGGYGLISTGGGISVGTFRGTSAAFNLSLTIASNVSTYNMRSAAISNGWNGSTPINLTVTVNSGVSVYAPNPGASAFFTGSPYPSGSTLTLLNYGTIMGGGGNGGAGGSANGTNNTYTAGGAGFGGGPALYAVASITVYNYGTIAGGGGGGGGGAAAGNTPDGKGSYMGAGGGGGGGRPFGVGGAAGFASGGTYGNTTSQTAGGTGTLTTAGAGGNRGVIGSAVGAGVGGAGGALGSNGSNGLTPDQGYVNLGQSSPGTGGAQGSYVLGNGFVTWAVAGTRLGSIS